MVDTITRKGNQDMGKRGPAPTPTVLKRLYGNPGKRLIIRVADLDLPPADTECPPVLIGEHARDLGSGLCRTWPQVSGPCLTDSS